MDKFNCLPSFTTSTMVAVYVLRFADLLSRVFPLSNFKDFGVYIYQRICMLRMGVKKRSFTD